MAPGKGWLSTRLSINHLAHFRQQQVLLLRVLSTPLQKHLQKHPFAVCCFRPPWVLKTRLHLALRQANLTWRPLLSNLNIKDVRVNPVIKTHLQQSWSRGADGNDFAFTANNFPTSSSYFSSFTTTRQAVGSQIKRRTSLELACTKEPSSITRRGK